MKKEKVIRALVEVVKLCVFTVVLISMIIVLGVGANAAPSLPNGWHEIGGQKYYFLDSKAVKGWMLDENENLYYFDLNSGVMYSERWANIDKERFYFKKDGRLAVNQFLEIDRKIYYFDQDGHIVKKKWIRESTFVEGYFNKKGVLTKKRYNYNNYKFDIPLNHRGWIQNNYYLDDTGYLGNIVTGWQYIDESWFYFYDDGHIAKDVTIDGHKLGSNGAALD